MRWIDKFREEEFWGEVQAGEHAPENQGRQPEEGPPPMGERPCPRCDVSMALHRYAGKCGPYTRTASGALTLVQP